MIQQSLYLIDNTGAVAPAPVAETFSNEPCGNNSQMLIFSQGRMSVAEVYQRAWCAFVESGIQFSEPLVTDGLLHRGHIAGDRPGTKNGAYFIHVDGRPNAWAMNHRSGTACRWSASGKREPLSRAQRVIIESEQRRRKDDIEKRQQQAATKARSLWRRLSSAIEHPYLV
ncbi:hypothetical protein RP726_14975 [Candidatus Methylospira mobilis]|uniref:hypothetical protein n=1 Tax=Candidatus Methylospira mobilis TaxID=1808979 RepID=UPI0028E235F2|nr:hypothetical protein [Candidatus Methylospira mobilis]WNV03732.1 hypothetical protein RP726_14975 [Candidatus Methylospira mobilis]